MRITNLSQTRSQKIPPDAGSSGVYEEIPVAISINGRHTSTVLLAPGDQKEYVSGFLYTEQYVTKPDEIESIRVERNRISVITTNIFTSPGPKKTILSGCGGAVSYIDTAKLPFIAGGYAVPKNELILCIREMNARNHESGESIVFSCLCEKNDILLCRCDIGEEQAVDRMIGAGLMKKIDFFSSYCICSVIITSEIVRKCLIAGIPLVLTNRHLTSLAIEIGQKNGLCVCAIQGDEILVYSHPERITG